VQRDRAWKGEDQMTSPPNSARDEKGERCLAFWGERSLGKEKGERDVCDGADRGGKGGEWRGFEGAG